ncbi:hypothetical protein [Neomoorella mulderi]|uniref:Uncharacterized protein n=1 Tax=Moorella mulderi DSM 14980 TaxID=1122241 RepID=A0A151B0T7_9FIRM|nr:hypothetical protein [Moorella mulderi]KYH33514.1 hypothetical protein MOMUL_02150 [Moorella mulderi DSM 14980]
MDNRWRWLRALIILAVAAFIFWQRAASGQVNVYEARALAVMGQNSKEGREILKELAEGRKPGVYHLQAEGDIAPAAGTEKIIGVTVSKDRGLLGIFSTPGSQPVMLDCIDTLPLQEVKVVQLEAGRNAILIRELLDERFGAYFLSSFYTLYTWQGEGLQEIWRKVAGNEERWHKKWLDQGEGWQGVSEQVTTDFTREEGRLAIKTISSQTLWSAPAATGPRTKIQSRTVTHTYRWEPAWGAMVMAVGRVNKATSLKERQGNKYADRLNLAAGEEVAVLEDEDLLSWLKPGEPSYWRVKTKSGRVGYVLKGHLDLLAGKA